MNSTRGITDLLQRLEIWLRAHAPRTAAAMRPETRPGCAAALAELPDLPDNVVVYFQWQTGMSRSLAYEDELLPGLELVDAVDCWMLTQLSREAVGGVESGSEAGDLSDRFLEDFVIFATSHTGYDLFIDLRPGALHGCISEWFQEGAIYPPVFSGFHEFLLGLADALEGKAKFFDATATASDGRVRWE